ncbi:MAG: type II toxin-antitoxin system RelE/ParE family toxin [Cyclobacteriaceae bacterium]|nr:type II toxin-antitoxin system RelE/ParE family toxin [Cyclobacteriaceae bacterium]MCX7638119.1 type II toxin-antitoxin system RelE/ParE family toxin [Cyclobacteriaceae bacterium]MDW8331087.1 type II toxin-antitoxin system RelE/ParE family toxin [Cyclobacteriaceae bacterium]
MVKIVWSELAVSDLEAIHQYVSRDSRYYASRLIEKIINRVDQLGAFPASGRVVPEFGKENIRELIEGG